MRAAAAFTAVVAAAVLLTPRAAVGRNVLSRAERLEQLAFGRRVFTNAGAADVPDVAIALRALPRFRMLLLTLERIGVDRPSLYVALIRHAERLSRLDATRGHTALAQFQGAIALVAGLVRARSVDRPRAESMLTALASVPLHRNGSYAGGIARWLQLELRPILPAGEEVEDSLSDALAGLRQESADLRRIRNRQGGVTIDDALDLYATALGQDAAVAHTLLEGVDVALGDALVAFAYAIDLGPLRFDGRIGCRHDFGLSNRNDSRDARAAWAPPKQVFETDGRWHVEGSLLGLDIALGPLPASPR